MNNAVLMIAVTSIRPECANEPALTERLRKAMRAAHQFWLSTDDDLRFTAALTAAHLETTDEKEKEQITRSARFLSAISAGMNGVPVDLAAAFGNDDFRPLPLMGLWNETKAL
jgi:hypothetical protein